MEKLAVIVPIPLLSHKDKVFWGVEDPENTKTRNRIIRNRKNAGLNPCNAFKIALESDGDIVFVIDDRRVDVDSTDPDTKLPLLPKSFKKLLKEGSGWKRILKPPSDLAFNVVSFSEEKLYKLGKKRLHLTSECGTAFYLLLDTLKLSEVTVCIPTMCEFNVKNAADQYCKTKVNIEITNLK
ncbi:MAG: hypothetical protein KBC12_00135 [Candidatus Pacebacteria bacterium]|nr:hypothetical protein [Candidatus Paceibacterota bacterium]MBP9851604.1 hypothetical protein [Candidatus Paceibacterota bacterium]